MELITFVEDGSQCLQKFIEDRETTSAYKIILMDCHMPVMDGYEASSTIRKLEKTKYVNIPPIRILAMTADTSRQKYEAAGMDGDLFKPFTKQILLDKVAEFLPINVMEAT